MNHIEGFFSKFKGAFENANRKKEVVCSACLSQSKTKILPAQVEISGRVLKLNISPSAKSAIFMRKTEILEEINQKLKLSLKDIF